MSDFYSSKPGPITPMAQVGHRIAIWVPPQWNCYKVLFYQGLSKSRSLVFNLGAIAPGVPGLAVQLAGLNLATDPPEAIQARFYVIDDIEVSILRGQSDQLFKTTNLIARTDKFSLLKDPCMHLTEFVVQKTDNPWAVAINPTGYANLQSRIAFLGFRFVLDDLHYARKTVEEVEKEQGPITFVMSGGM